MFITITYYLEHYRVLKILPDAGLGVVLVHGLGDDRPLLAAVGAGDDVGHDPVGPQHGVVVDGVAGLAGIEQGLELGCVDVVDVALPTLGLQDGVFVHRGRVIFDILAGPELCKIVYAHFALGVGTIFSLHKLSADAQQAL